MSRRCTRTALSAGSSCPSSNCPRPRRHPAAALPDRPNQRELTIEQRKEIIRAYYASTTLMTPARPRTGWAEKTQARRRHRRALATTAPSGQHGSAKERSFEGSGAYRSYLVPGMKTAGHPPAHSPNSSIFTPPPISVICRSPNISKATASRLYLPTQGYRPTGRLQHHPHPPAPAWLHRQGQTPRPLHSHRPLSLY